jgi:hypothetical protein
MKKNLQNYRVDVWILLAVLALAFSSLACGLVQPKPTPTRTPSVKVFPTKMHTQTPIPSLPLIDSGSLIHQWAATGEATSEFGSLSWSAMQAGGKPDTPACGDASTAWAAAQADTVESLTVYFMEEPLIPTEINIVQTYNPSQVVAVELLDPYSEHADALVYEAVPRVTTECPYTLSIPVTQVDYPVMGVRITIDQGVLGVGWNEIDAVELVGYAQAGMDLQGTDPGLPEGIWDTVEALPIYPTAENVNYLDDSNLLYAVNNSSRQEVLSFLMDNLLAAGWRLDVDDNGQCLDVKRCLSKSEGLDYRSVNNMMWHFIHLDSPDAYLSLSLVPNAGTWGVGMSLK